jgi:hypothetical protein
VEVDEVRKQLSGLINDKKMWDRSGKMMPVVTKDLEAIQWVLDNCRELAKEQTCKKN